MDEQKHERQQNIDQVIDVDSMYGYDKTKEEQKEDKKAEWMKMLLQHLDNKKKYYLRKVD